MVSGHNNDNEAATLVQWRTCCHANNTVDRPLPWRPGKQWEGRAQWLCGIEDMCCTGGVCYHSNMRINTRYKTPQKIPSLGKQ